METSTLKLPRLGAADIVKRLERLIDGDAELAVAFDGDGTLWTGDVGEIVFEYAVERGLLQDTALPRLQEEARSFGAPEHQSPNETARTLYSSYRAGVYPEAAVCEMMVWCYAGMTEAQLQELASEALSAADFARTINERIRPLLDWARESGCRTVVISASPALVVNQAASCLGFDPRDVLGGRPSIVDRSIAPAMLEPLPYGKGKVRAGRRAIGAARWLASYGDSVFDLDMMREARLAVGVRPKPDLERALAQLAGAVILKSE